MITIEKQYGSYILQKVKYDDINGINNTNTIIDSECSIGPEWQPLILISKTTYNHDTCIFRFKLPSDTQALNLPLGAFLLVRAPGCDHDGSDAIRPYTSITNHTIQGYFEILCKKYIAWGVKESKEMNFLFTKTNHSYKPPGTCSNYIHQLNIGDTLEFKHTTLCLPRYNMTSFMTQSPSIKTLTLISVGAGIAPMIQIIRYYTQYWQSNQTTAVTTSAIAETTPSHSYDDSIEDPIKISLIYGARTVKDILLREQLDEWYHVYPTYFSLHYSIGSRWNNIHMGACTKSEYIPPVVPTDVLAILHASEGWINEEKIKSYGYSPSTTTRIIVCGLPGIYDKLCGPRNDLILKKGSILDNLGYTTEMVIKL